MRYSKQRELIEMTLKENELHMSADEIYSLLKPKYPSLSLATVYRNLNSLYENGAINKICINNSSDRFDINLKSHSHFVCIKCSSIIDIDAQMLDNLKNEFDCKLGIDIVPSQVVINGFCKECRS